MREENQKLNEDLLIRCGTSCFKYQNKGFLLCAFSNQNVLSGSFLFNVLSS